jgi:hypothetical protein
VSKYFSGAVRCECGVVLRAVSMKDGRTALNRHRRTKKHLAAMAKKS